MRATVNDADPTATKPEAIAVRIRAENKSLGR